MFSVLSCRNNSSVKYCTELRSGEQGAGLDLHKASVGIWLPGGREKQGAIEFTLLIVNSTGGSTLNYWDGAMVGLGMLPARSATEEIPPLSSFVRAERTGLGS